MISTCDHSDAESSFRALKPVLDQRYPKGWFVALEGNEVVADGSTLDALLANLQALGKDPRNCLAVQAGVDYPEYAVIFLAETGR